MPDAEKSAEQSRIKYWARLYTILESLVLCWDIQEELRRLQEIKSFKTYAQNLNLWMAFYSHLGRIHDMVKAFAGELNKPELLKPFDEYWKERHIVLHGPKVPMKWVCNTLAVPPLGAEPKQWNDKMLWRDLTARDFELLGNEVSTILGELAKRLDRCLAELRKVLPAEYGWKPVLWDSVVKKPTDQLNPHGQINLLVSTPEPLSNTYMGVSGVMPNISGSKGI